MLCTWQEKTSKPVGVVLKFQIAICQCGQRDKHSSAILSSLEFHRGGKNTFSNDRKLEKTRRMESLPQIHPFRLMLTNGY